MQSIRKPFFSFTSSGRFSRQISTGDYGGIPFARIIGSQVPTPSDQLKKQWKRVYDAALAYHRLSPGDITSWYRVARFHSLGICGSEAYMQQMMKADWLGDRPMSAEWAAFDPFPDTALVTCGIWNVRDHVPDDVENAYYVHVYSENLRIKQKVLMSFSDPGYHAPIDLLDGPITYVRIFDNVSKKYASGYYLIKREPR